MYSLSDLPDDEYDIYAVPTRRRAGNLCIGPRLVNNSSLSFVDNPIVNNSTLSEDGQISDSNNAISDEIEANCLANSEPPIATCQPLHTYQAKFIYAWMREKKVKQETNDAQYIAYSALLQDRFAPNIPTRKLQSGYAPFDNAAVWSAFLLGYSNKYHYSELQLQGAIDMLLLLQDDGVIPHDYFIPKSARTIMEMDRYLVEVPLGMLLSVYVVLLHFVYRFRTSFTLMVSVRGSQD